MEENMKGIIFDVDGTLWDSTAVAAVSWNKVIKNEGIEYKELDEFDLKKEFGKPMEANPPIYNTNFIMIQYLQ